MGETATSAAVESSKGGLLSMVLMFAAMFAIFYFVLIRPQQKQQKKHQQLLAGLKKGDEVILSSGIVGKIFAVEERFVTLEIADKTRIKVLRQAVQAVAQGAENAPIEAPKN